MTPIKTVIKNNTAVAKAVNYIGKSPVWLPANGEATVDFEVWSVADDSQKTAIKTLIQNGTIELTVMVLGKDGEYTVASFDPTGGAKVAAKKEPVYLKPQDPIKQIAAEKDHIVKVGSQGSQKALESMGAKPVGFEDEDILPAREVKNGEPEPAEEAKQEEKPEEVAAEDTAATADNGESGAKKAGTKKGSKAKA